MSIQSKLSELEIQVNGISDRISWINTFLAQRKEGIWGVLMKGEAIGHFSTLEQLQCRKIDALDFSQATDTEKEELRARRKILVTHVSRLLDELTTLVDSLSVLASASDLTSAWVDWHQIASNNTSVSQVLACRSYYGPDDAVHVNVMSPSYNFELVLPTNAAVSSCLSKEAIDSCFSQLWNSFGSVSVVWIGMAFSVFDKLELEQTANRYGINLMQILSSSSVVGASYCIDPEFALSSGERLSRKLTCIFCLSIRTEHKIVSVSLVRLVDVNGIHLTVLASNSCSLNSNDDMLPVLLTTMESGTAADSYMKGNEGKLSGCVLLSGDVGLDVELLRSWVPSNWPIIVDLDDKRRCDYASFMMSQLFHFQQVEQQTGIPPIAWFDVVGFCIGIKSMDDELATVIAGDTAAPCNGSTKIIARTALDWTIDNTRNINYPDPPTPCLSILMSTSPVDRSRYQVLSSINIANYLSPVSVEFDLNAASFLQIKVDGVVTYQADLTQLSSLEANVRPQPHQQVVAIGSSDSLKDAGNKFLQKKDFSNALKLYCSSLELNPYNSIVLSNRSALYQQMGELQLALADADRCIDLDPSWTKGYLRKANTLEIMGYVGLAEQIYKRRLEVDSENPSLKSALARLLRQFDMQPATQSPRINHESVADEKSNAVDNSKQPTLPVSQKVAEPDKSCIIS